MLKKTRIVRALWACAALDGGCGNAFMASCPALSVHGRICKLLLI